MKTLFKIFCVACVYVVLTGITLADGVFAIKSVEAHQRYPWNGHVDVSVMILGDTNDFSNVHCKFVAANAESGETIAVATFSQIENDEVTKDLTTSRYICTRHYLWNADRDVGNVKIEDLILAVDMFVGVQLWDGGPYWAECNIGAAKPEEVGYYFWWGDTVGSRLDADNGRLVSVSDGATFCFKPENCETYGKYWAALGSSYDSATAYLGVPWRMPTEGEFSALINNCATTWMTRDGIYGILISGKGSHSSKSIFLPAAGYVESSSPRDKTYGYYWSSTGFNRTAYDAWYLRFNPSLSVNCNRNYDYCLRYYGRSVRAVRDCASVAISSTNVTTHLMLDCRTGVRICSADGEVLRYDATWCAKGDAVRITDNGTVVVTGTVGCCAWHPDPSCSAPHMLVMEILSHGQIVSTETVKMALGYVHNVVARQLWPHKKVEIRCEIAPDTKNAFDNNAKLSIGCSADGVNYVAQTLIGDLSVSSGVHRVVWDVDSDDVKMRTKNAVFDVGISGVLRGDYMVIDLSGGLSATNYPVTMLEGVPEGGWSDEYKTEKIVLRYIHEGTFIMCEDQSEGSHRVSLSKGFFMGVFEVTQRQWELVMGTRPSHFSSVDRYGVLPLESVTYDMIRGSSIGAEWPNSSAVDEGSFIGVLRKKTGLNIDLPTEAQWEYACRAGYNSAYGISSSLAILTRLGWCSANAASRTHPVGEKNANTWGLYDMHGNVCEWCLDWCGSLPYGEDPVGSANDCQRIYRGGCYSSPSERCTSFYRNYSFPSSAWEGRGFRIKSE